MDRKRKDRAEHSDPDFDEIDKWHIARIKEGIAAADGGDIASDEELAAAHAKWGVKPK